MKISNNITLFFYLILFISLIDFGKSIFNGNGKRVLLGRAQYSSKAFGPSQMSVGTYRSRMRSRSSIRSRSRSRERSRGKPSQFQIRRYNGPKSQYQLTRL
uniref:Uncharacterized protein n=1 Tax=Strongyloides venezuelensis TaxID=75913 RepID=A0A0K0EUS1_STRVS